MHIPAQDISAVVLAGGRASRMGGLDKGLLPWAGQALATHALARLAPQVGTLLLSANRNLPAYEALAQPYGAQVITDTLADHAGPLAGFLSALTHCRSPWLLTTPCDSPHLPTDLAQRLATACAHTGARLAIACAHTTNAAGQTQWQRQPVFCLLHTQLRPSLERFLQSGARKIGLWAQQEGAAEARFGPPHDDPRAFYNANTPEELRALPP